MPVIINSRPPPWFNGITLVIQGLAVISIWCSQLPIALQLVLTLIVLGHIVYNFYRIATGNFAIVIHQPCVEEKSWTLTLANLQKIDANIQHFVRFGNIILLRFQQGYRHYYCVVTKSSAGDFNFRQLAINLNQAPC